MRCRRCSRCWRSIPRRCASCSTCSLARSRKRPTGSALRSARRLRRRPSSDARVTAVSGLRTTPAHAGWRSRIPTCSRAAVVRSAPRAPCGRKRRKPSSCGSPPRRRLRPRATKWNGCAATPAARCSPPRCQRPPARKSMRRVWGWRSPCFVTAPECLITGWSGSSRAWACRCRLRPSGNCWRRCASRPSRSSMRWSCRPPTRPCCTTTTPPCGSWICDGRAAPPRTNWPCWCPSARAPSLPTSWRRWPRIRSPYTSPAGSTPEKTWPPCCASAPQTWPRRSRCAMRFRATCARSPTRSWLFA